MKVTIERKPRTFGYPLFKKTVHDIHVQLELSEEEKHIVEQLGLRKYVVYKHSDSSSSDPNAGITLQRLLNDGFLRNPNAIATCSDALEANVEEARIREGLQTLKNVMEANKKPAKAKDTFEL